MKKILIFGAFLGFLACAPAMSAVRDGTATTMRTKSQNTPTQTRTSTVLRSNTDTGRTTVMRNTATRNDTKAQTTRAGALRLATTPTRTAVSRPTRQIARSGAITSRLRKTNNTRTATNARAAEDTQTTPRTMAETRTGAAYNQCKDAYFQCMDQFCQLKSDEYRRCSCSERIFNLKSVRENISDTNDKLTEFTENLDVVGMTAAQAKAMHTASDGENALTADTSASKALLNAIMKSIRGEDATVSGKLSDLNSINLSFDTSNAFGITDAAQVIASYNGTELYNAVYPSCRSAVTADCTDAALQRAVTAYLMAIEQDCNTVQTALENKQKELKGAIREGSAMLDLARVENRKKHNSDTLAMCINNIEAAILSEQVCGANYHKCLDNGEFIDVSTGAPISGVVRFYELGNLLKFDLGKNAADQQLSKVTNNQKFVKAFEAKTKKFATDALDKCTEIADTAWSEYLDKALLAIYYAQQSKVETIKTGCFDLISACYEERDAAITAAMATLIDGSTEISLMPDKIVLTKQMCSDYIDSCNNMFADDENNRNIIADYIAEQTDKDRLDACRAIVKQCFDDFGGSNYENFYYPSSGLFATGLVDTGAFEYNSSTSTWELKDHVYKKSALDWFSLYSYDINGQREMDPETHKPIYVSECAKRVAAVSSCEDLIEKAFGGLDLVIAKQGLNEFGTYNYQQPEMTLSNPNPYPYHAYAYGWTKTDDLNSEENIWESGTSSDPYTFQNRRLRPTGVATEIYNNIIDLLSTQCMNLQGKFIEAQSINHLFYATSGADDLKSICNVYWDDVAHEIPFYYRSTNDSLELLGDEYMCPRDYTLNVDAKTWGICSCWENGGRRSKDGKSGKCTPALPVNMPDDHPEKCLQNDSFMDEPGADDWCISAVNKETNQVCPLITSCFDGSNDCAVCPNDPDSPTNCDDASHPTCDRTCQTDTCVIPTMGDNEPVVPTGIQF